MDGKYPGLVQIVVMIISILTFFTGMYTFNAKNYSTVNDLQVERVQRQADIGRIENKLDLIYNVLIKKGR